MSPATRRGWKPAAAPASPAQPSKLWEITTAPAFRLRRPQGSRRLGIRWRVSIQYLFRGLAPLQAGIMAAGLFHPAHILGGLQAAGPQLRPVAGPMFSFGGGCSGMGAGDPSGSGV